MGYILDILPKNIITDNPEALFPNSSVVQASYLNATGLPLEKQINDLAKSIGDLKAQISTLEKNQSNWEFIINDISKLYDNKYMVDSYPAVEKYGSLKTPLEDFRPMSQVEGGDKPCEWFGQAVCHNQQRERVKARRNYARAQVEGIKAQLPTLRKSLEDDQLVLEDLNKQFSSISNQNLAELKAKADIKIKEEQSRTESKLADAQKLAQEQAPLLAAQRTRRFITIAAIVGGVALLGGAIFLRNK